MDNLGHDFWSAYQKINYGKQSDLTTKKGLTLFIPANKLANKVRGDAVVARHPHPLFVPK